MKRLVRTELDKALRNQWFVVAVAIATILAVASAGMSIDMQRTFGLSMSQDEWMGMGATGAYSSWVFVGTGDLFVSGIFFFILPLLVTLPYCASLLDEENTGALAHQYANASRRHVITARYIAVFISSGLVAAIPLMVNFAVLLCCVPASTPEVSSNLYMAMVEQELWSGLYYSLPLLYVVANTALDFILAGAWGGAVLAFSTIARGRVELLVGSYLMVLAIDFGSKYLFGLLGVQAVNVSLLSLLHAGNSGIVRTPLPIMLLIVFLFGISVFLLKRFLGRDLL